MFDGGIMRKIHIALVLATAFFTQSVFAHDEDLATSSDKPCSAIVKACLTAGYLRTDSPSKAFWHDCMKPVVLGQTVAGVTVDPATVKACRTNKLEELKNELQEFEKANSK
jgi:hypothetical protein